MLLGVFQPGAEQKPAPLAAYFEHLHRRDRSIIAWEQFFDEWDVLVCPPAMTTAFTHRDTGAPLLVDGRELEYWAVSAQTMLFNYTGHPAVVVPFKRDGDGVPLGIQLVGKRWNEARLLAIANHMTETGEFHRPPGY